MHYLATARRWPGDAEWDARIAAHRARRPAGWATVEEPDVPALLRAAEPGVPLLVDDLATWLTGVLDGAQEGRHVRFLHRRPSGGPPGAVRRDPRVPVRVIGPSPCGCQVTHRRVRGEQALGVPGLPRPGSAQDEDRYGFAPRWTRGFGIRNRRGCVARVNAYQPVPSALTSSFGNFARTLDVVLSPR